MPLFDALFRFPGRQRPLFDAKAVAWVRGRAKTRNLTRRDTLLPAAAFFFFSRNWPPKGQVSRRCRGVSRDQKAAFFDHFCRRGGVAGGVFWGHLGVAGPKWGCFWAFQNVAQDRKHVAQAFRKGRAGVAQVSRSVAGFFFLQKKNLWRSIIAKEGQTAPFGAFLATWRIGQQFGPTNSPQSRFPSILQANPTPSAMFC